MIKKIKYIIVLFICFFTFNISVKAYTSYINYDTNFNVNSFFDYSTLLNNSRCHDETYYQFITDFISLLDFEHSRYHLFITFSHYNNPSNYNKGYFQFYAIPKSIFTNHQFDISFYRTSSATNGFLAQNNSISLNSTGVQRLDMTLGYLYNVDHDFCANSNYNSFLETNVVSSFISYFNNLEWQQGISISEQYVSNSYFSTSSGSLVNINFDTSAQLFNIPYTNSPSTLNSNSVDIDGFYLPFFSSYPLTLSNSITYPFNSNDLVFKKNIYFADNQTRYSPGDIFPTYYDYFINPSSDSNFNNLTQLNDIFVSNIDKSNLSSTEIKYNFNYYSEDWVSALRFQFDYFGRVNNETYYSYEPINCTGSWGSSYGNINNLYTASLNNISCSTDLTNYDYIYLRIRKKYSDISYNDTLYNFSYSTNNGFINVPNVSNGDNKYYIMDYFSNLPSNFNILLSSSNSKSYMTYKSENKNVLASLVDRDKNFISSLATTNLIFGSYNDSSVMVYNYTPNYNDTSNLFLFFSPNTIVSIGNNGNYSYYDSDNTIVNGNITNNYQISYSNYDLSYYLNIVNDFINDLQESSFEFSTVVQEFYNGLPLIFQNFIFVIFILFCTYSIVILVKK